MPAKERGVVPARSLDAIEAPPVCSDQRNEVRYRDAIRVGHSFVQSQHASGLENAGQTAEALGRVLDLPKDMHQQGHIEAGGRERQRIAGIRHRIAHVGAAPGNEPAPRLGEHLRLEVNQLEVPLGDRGGECEAEVSGSRPQLDDPVGGPEWKAAQQSPGRKQESADRVVQQPGKLVREGSRHGGQWRAGQATRVSRSGRLAITASASGAAKPGGAIQAVPSPRLLAGRMSRSRLSPTNSTRESAGKAARARRKIAAEGLMFRAAEEKAVWVNTPSRPASRNRTSTADGTAQILETTPSR